MIKQTAKTSYTQSNFSLVDDTCLKQTAVKKLSKHNSQYVSAVAAVNHRAVTHLTFPYFLDGRLRCDHEGLHKNSKSHFIFGPTRRKPPKKGLRLTGEFHSQGVLDVRF